VEETPLTFLSKTSSKLVSSAGEASISVCLCVCVSH